MKEIYVIDACALINAAHNYNMAKKSFTHIWTTFDELIDCGRLLSSAEIMDELKDDDLRAWAKKRKTLFVPLTKEIQEKTSSILTEFPTMIKIRSTDNSNADPFLIATAALREGAIVVTDERPGDIKTKDYRIPNVCQALSIPCINLRVFLDRVLE